MICMHFIRRVSSNSVLKEINDMGFSHSSLDSFNQKGYIEKYTAEVLEILMQIVYLNKNKRGY